MKYITTILFLLLATFSFCQSNEIYRLAFSDSSNFRLTTSLGHQQPKHLFIIDTTLTWNTKRFWLKELDDKSDYVVKKLEKDEHHYYNHTYLFKDEALDRIINDKEKKSLSQKAGLFASTKITLQGNNYSTVSSPGNINGFYFIATEPLFSSDMKFAFIDIMVIRSDQDQSYFGTICLVYEKQQHEWKKIKVKNHVIL